MRVLGFHHVAVQVRDVEGAAAFYREVLGLPEQVRHHRDDGSLRSIWLTMPGGGFLALEDCVGTPSIDDFRRDTPGLHLLAFRIAREERSGLERRIEALGVPIVHRTRWSFYVRDPEGNRIGLSHHPEDPVPEDGPTT